MQLQASQTTEKASLKELRKALGTGETAAVVNSHSDEILISLLKLHQRPAVFAMRYLLYTVLFSLLVFLGALFNFWDLPIWLSLVIFAPVVLILRIPQTRAEAWIPFQQRLERAALPVLLDANALNISPLRFSIQAGLMRRLRVASPEELEALTLQQRKQLVNFTLAQVRPRWVSFHLVPETETQAATLGYLALATLKQPGAEKPDRRGLTSAMHNNLRAAIDEYLEAVGRL